MDNTPGYPARRRFPPWAVVAIVVVVLVALAAGGVAAVTAGIIGYGTGASVADSATARDKALQEADPAGGTACNYLDMQMSGIGTWDGVAEHLPAATTPGIRAATTERELYDACTAAGANLQPWPGKLPSFD